MNQCSTDFCLPLNGLNCLLLSHERAGFRLSVYFWRTQLLAIYQWPDLSQSQHRQILASLWQQLQYVLIKGFFPPLSHIALALDSWRLMEFYFWEYWVSIPIDSLLLRFMFCLGVLGVKLNMDWISLSIKMNLKRVIDIIFCKW